jgi:hypothetical protein
MYRSRTKKKNFLNVVWLSYSPHRQLRGRVLQHALLLVSGLLAASTGLGMWRFTLMA